jgi:glycosyltransferase involved in cell wall biosynthesis
MPSPDRIRVGYLVKMFPRLSETFILNEILELERQGIDLHVFSLKRPIESVIHAQANQVRARVTYLPEKTRGETQNIVKAQARVCCRHPQSYLRIFLRSVRRNRHSSFLRLYQACRVIQDMTGIQHLHAHFAMEPCEVAWLAHCLTGISFSVTTHAKDIYQAARLTSPALREQIGGARFVVANSQLSAGYLAASLNGQSTRIATIYNGVDLETFSPRKDRFTEPLILSVGRLVEKKGFPVLLQACQILRERRISFRCEIVGAGTLERRLQDMIQACRLEGQVKMVGSLTQQELLGYYHRAAIFALPCQIASDGDRDILPNVLKEAMAIGVPVVTTNVAGIEELIENEVSGLLTPPCEPRALARALERLLQDAPLRDRLTSNARRMVEQRFDMRTSFVRLKDLFGDVVRDHFRQRRATRSRFFWWKR